MLDSTMELISLAASNSLAVFCVCNLIIAFLLVGTSKPQFYEDKKPNAIPTIANAENVKKETGSPGEEANTSIKGREEKSPIANMYMADNEEEFPNQEEDDGDNDDDDELRKRVEEFIEKINSSWKAEKLKT